MAVPPAASQKQEREIRRAEKLAKFQREQKAAKRKRVLGFTFAGVGAAAVIALIAGVIIVNAQPADDPDSISIEGLRSWDDLESVHVEDAVDYQSLYDMSPPAGGQHNQMWLNCGIYDQPQPNENAVHSLEHGAVWVTYNPDEVSGDDLEALRDEMPSTYAILSPFPELQAPVVASAWGQQVELTGVDDERLESFIDKFWRSADVPESGSSCSGALEGAGLVS
jgi:hypothetical protein